MKLLIISNLDITNENSVGVLNKIFGQVEAFSNYGIDVDLIYNKLHFVILNKICCNEKIKFRPSSTKDYYNKILNLININKYDVIYIRYSLSSYYFFDFLKNIKGNNPRVKVILDFPTYPYEQELNNERVLQIDKFFRKYNHRFVDFGVCYNKLEYIHDIPVYYVGNGINLKNVNCKNMNIKKINRIDLIAVANIAFWQGYDRIIEGLKRYYDNSNLHYLIYFNVVGLGEDITKLTTLVNKYNLDKYVTFHGYKSGRDLDELFDKCDIAIGTLGMYRKGMKDGSTLKAREYCARGIPFILGYDDLDFPLEFKYALKLSNNDISINIDDIIKFYNMVYKNRNVVAEMRSYAEKNLSWESKLKVVVEKIK